uniref:MFS domain-containing protein n=1 Tax=Echinostoma caproni TaxID=27848 RepID=A0A183AAD1_9TREM
LCRRTYFGNCEATLRREAAWFPGFYKIWAAWAPPNERGLLVGFSYAGVHIGNAITLPISGALCRSASFGWASVFYFYGAFSFIYAVLWATLVYDTPRSHPRISVEEQRFIIAQCGDPTPKRKKKSKIPIKAILTSVPVWAFVAINVGFDWNGYTFLTSMPAYMREVLQFDIQENAGLSALPYVGLWIGQMFTGMFGPGIVLIVMSFFTCHWKYLAVALFTFGLMLNSGVFTGGLLNPIELSPTHAGFIFAGSNSLSAATGFIGPLVVSALTPNKSYEEWRYVFYLGAAIYAVTGCIFLFFSSSSIQPWAIEPRDPWSSGELGVQVENGTPDPVSNDHKVNTLKEESKPMMDSREHLNRKLNDLDGTVA